MTDTRPGDILEVRIERIVPRGLGIGFADGLTVFVPLSAVGDELSVRVREVKKRVAFAEIVEVLGPGAARVPAPCPHFGVCGGCDFQHLAYEAQLDAKVNILRDCLSRIGKIVYDREIPIVASPLEFEYRSRVRWHIDPAARAFGYMRRDSNELVDVRVCPILTPPLQATLTELRSNIDQHAAGEIEAASGGDTVSIYSHNVAGDAAEVTVDLAGESYTFTAAAFFQANQALIAKLIELAVGDAAGKTALDLYSGVGLFTLPLARRFEMVVAVEGNPRAVEFARRNAARSALENIETHASGVGKFLAAHTIAVPDLVLLDPPRSGPEPGVIDALITMRPGRISYVSCDPAILARDLKQLSAAGFAIDSITALDLFPQTHHVETLAHLSS